MGFGIKSVSSSSFLANTPCAGINAKAASFVVVLLLLLLLLPPPPPPSAFIIFVRISEGKAERCRAALHESVVLVIGELVVALDDDDDVEGGGEDRDEAQLKNRAEASSDDGACASVIIL